MMNFPHAHFYKMASWRHFAECSRLTGKKTKWYGCIQDNNYVGNSVIGEMQLNCVLPNDMSIFQDFSRHKKIHKEQKVNFLLEQRDHTIDRMYLSCYCLIASSKWSPLTYGRIFGKKSNINHKKRTTNNSRRTEDKWDKKIERLRITYYFVWRLSNDCPELG